MALEASGCGAFRKDCAGKGCVQRSRRRGSTAARPAPRRRGGGGPRRRPSGFHFKLKLEAFKAWGGGPGLVPPPRHGERSPGWHTAALRPRPLPLGSRTSPAQPGAGRGVACDVASRFGSPPPSRPVYKTSPGDRFAKVDAGGGELVGGGGASRARASSDVCPCLGGGSRQ